MSLDKSILAQLLGKVAVAACRHPSWFIYPQLGLALFCGLYSLHDLKVDLNRNRLMGAGTSYHESYLKFRQEFPGEAPQLVRVESQDAERNRQFIERLASRLQPQTNLFTGRFDRESLQNTSSWGGGRELLLAVRPRSPALAAPAIEGLRQAIQQTQFELPGLNVGLTGSLVLDYDELRQVKEDATLATIAALALGLILFAVAYREVGRALQVALCLLIGLGYTLGLATLTVGHLSLLGLSFAPMLLGLAIDFGLHLLSRYEEELGRRRTAFEAVQRASVFTGPGIVLGALTTAAGFLAMGLTSFRGLREVGLLCGGGLLLCLIPLFTTLPALLMRDQRKPREPQGRALGQARWRIERLMLQHPLPVLILALVLCAAAAAMLGRVRFDYDLLHLQSRELASVRAEQQLIQSGPRSVLFAAVVADSPQQAQAYAARLERLPAVARVESAARELRAEPEPKLSLIGEDLAPALREQFIGRSGKLLLQVYPRKDIWQYPNQRELIEQLQNVVPPERVTGAPVQIYHNTLRLKHSYEQAGWYALGAIALMLFLHFRSVGSVLLALLPLGLGSLWALGLMGALGIPFNPVNIMTLPLVVGLGVTHGLQSLHRVAEEQRPAVFARSTGKAILVSGLTAMSGFGTLLLAKHQGLQSLGKVMSAGIAACMVAALMVLPVLLSLLQQRPLGRVPGPGAGPTRFRRAAEQAPRGFLSIAQRSSRLRLD